MRHPNATVVNRTLVEDCFMKMLAMNDDGLKQLVDRINEFYKGRPQRFRLEIPTPETETRKEPIHET